MLLVLTAILCSAILTLLPSVFTGKIIDEGRYNRYVELEEELYNQRNDYSGRRKFYYEF